MKSKALEDIENTFVQAAINARKVVIEFSFAMKSILLEEELEELIFNNWYKGILEDRIDLFYSN